MARLLCSILLLLALAACGSRSPDGPQVGRLRWRLGSAGLRPLRPRAERHPAFRAARPTGGRRPTDATPAAIAPSIGSVLVLRRSGRLPSGHVAVVSQVLGRRQILVTQANWVHHRVSQDQPVIDVSAANDWSMVRVWWPPAGEMGVTDYPAYGFIRADRPATHDQLVAATPRAIRLAANE